MRHIGKENDLNRESDFELGQGRGYDGDQK